MTRARTPPEGLVSATMRPSRTAGMIAPGTSARAILLGRGRAAAWSLRRPKARAGARWCSRTGRGQLPYVLGARWQGVSPGTVQRGPQGGSGVAVRPGFGAQAAVAERVQRFMGRRRQGERGERLGCC